MDPLKLHKAPLTPEDEFVLPLMSEEDFINDDAFFMLLYPGDPSFSKMEADEKGTTLALGGKSLLRIIEWNPQFKIQVLNEKPSFPVMQLKEHKGKIYAHKVGSNDLVILTKDYKEEELSKGFPDQSNTFRMVRTGHTGDDQRFLWCRGEVCLTNYFISNRLVQNLKGFWKTQAVEDDEEEVTLLPQIALSDHMCTHFFGVGVDPKGCKKYPANSQYLCYYKDGDIAHMPVVEAYKNKISHVECAEINLKGDKIVFGGHLNGKAVIGLGTFNAEFKGLWFGAVMSDEGRDKTITCITRFLGKEIYLVGTKCHIYTYNTNGDALKLMKIFKVQDAVDIIEIRIRWNKILALDSNGKVFLRRCNYRLDLEKANQAEYGAVSAEASAK